MTDWIDDPTLTREQILERLSSMEPAPTRRPKDIVADLCPICMSPLGRDELEITEPPLLYNAVAEELGLDPVAS